MNVRIISYPASFEFETDAKLNKFDEHCAIRQMILLKELVTQKIESPHHDYEDYVIEKVVRRGDKEYWYLGS